MAAKPDLSTAAGVQNVVVYVSNDNFAHTYAVDQQNVPPQGNVHPSGYPSASHTMASMGQPKGFSEKQHIFTSNGQVVTNPYFAGVISQNGFPLNSIGYQNGAIIKNCPNTEVLACERQQAGPGRPENIKRDECDNQERYAESYVTVLGSDVPTQSVRCDSVRSETAESSCSSLSSADEGMVVVQNRSPEMVVYDPSVSVRPGGVVLVGPQPLPQHAQGNAMVGVSQPQFVTVPYGWKRLVNNGAVVYISPSNSALSSLEQVKEYLLTSGTCKCGLECHFKYDTVFNFDPKVIGKPWVMSPDTNTGDLTKLCNHKRKIMAMASLDCKPPDPGAKMRKELAEATKLEVPKVPKLDFEILSSCKYSAGPSSVKREGSPSDYGIKRKKRKIGVPYAGGVSVSQILAQREKLALGPQGFNKDVVGNPQQVWSPNAGLSNRLQGFPENQPNPMLRCQEQSGRMMAGSPLVLGDNNIMAPQANVPSNLPNQQIHQSGQQAQISGPNIHLHSRQIIGPNGQLINVQGPIPHGHNHIVNQPQNQNSGVVIQGQNNMQTQHQQPQHNRLFVNGQPSEPSGPGRPNIQMMPGSIANQQAKAADIQQRMQQQQHLYNSQAQYQPVDSSKNIRQYNQVLNGIRPQCMSNQNQLVPNVMHIQQQQQIQQQKMQWQNRMQQSMNQQSLNQVPVQQPHLQAQNSSSNIYERVPPLHQHTPPAVWPEEIRRKKVKLNKVVKNRQYHVIDNNCQIGSHGPCPNIDVRQIPNENNRPVLINQLQHNHNSSSPSFMEDPSGYLAQQTALLNNTINRQTGANTAGYICNSPNTSVQGSQQNIITISNSQASEVPLPSNMMSNMKPQNLVPRLNQNINIVKQQIQPNPSIPQQYNQINQIQMQQNVADSSVLHDHQMLQYPQQCQGCVTNPNIYGHNQKGKSHSRTDSEPGTPSSCGNSEDPVTSSIYLDKHSNQSSPDTRPIQGGTVSTSNVSPMDSSHSDPPTPNPHTYTPTPPHRHMEVTQSISNNPAFNMQHQQHQQQIVQIVSQSRDANNSINFMLQTQQMQPKQESYHYPHSSMAMSRVSERNYISGVVTTMASGRTVGSNTITSVLAGRANTATVSINSPATLSGSNTPTSSAPTIQTQAININVSKSPLEMVQSVVSSIQVPQSHHHNIGTSTSQTSPQISPQIIKHSPTGLPPGHILVSSNGQLIMASAGNGQANVMAPPPPKVMGGQNAMPPISVSPMITNVTAAVTQVIPAVAQQVLGQQTVLVNALPAPFVLQPGVTMTMDGMTVGQNMQIPQIVTGNVIQQQIQLDSADPRRAPALLSPETKKKGKKRKMSQTVAGMLHIAAQQNSGVVMSQGFPQQIQMTHSPQGITTTPVMQALTIVPSKNGGPPQIVMNGQAVANANLGAQQLITNSQPAQQINLLQPVNLINGTTGVVQNFPAIQQFIVPNLGGMVMNPDGTATILQDTSNLGMQLQIQNVNGQNVLTPIQNNGMFNGGQSILAAGPAGMVIRAPTSQGKIIQQQHSPGAQFLSPNGSQFVVNGTQFSGQLSPLVASVSPSQVTFSTSPQQIRPNNPIQPPQQEYIQMNGQMGQTLMVPCTPQNTNIAASSSNQQNTTFVQQNTTIVQQQTTMVANNPQLQNYQQNNQQGQNVARSATLNMDQQNFIISSNDNKQLQTVMVQQRASPQDNVNYRQSVSTQTAVNQNTQAVTTNTFCQTSTLSAGSPPDTTTLSPMASGGQSPTTADTTTHSGSTDDGLSPAPSNCSASCSDINVPGRPGSCTMAMVHCVSSSEPDLAETNTQNCESDWRRTAQMKQEFASSIKQEYTDLTGGHMHYSKKPHMATHVAFAESSNLVSGIHFLEQKMKEEVVSSRNYAKMVNQKKTSDMMVVMESRHMHSSLFDDDDESKNPKESPNEQEFVVGDLVWGSTKGFSAWPGKIMENEDGVASVKWFGNEKYVSKIKIEDLQTLTEGLDAHHLARKKARTSRKLNTQLEKAIQEAMSELDKDFSKKEPPKQKVSSSNSKKTATRLRSGQR